MASREIVRDAPRQPVLPPDPDVLVPESVRRRSAAADVMHAQAYQTAAATGPSGASGPAETGVSGPSGSAPAPTGQVGPSGTVTAPVTTHADNPDEGNYEHRYNSMKGRHDAQQRTIASMQEQMDIMAQELMRSNQLLQQTSRGPAIPPNPPPAPQPVQRRITQADIDNYGGELVDLVTRAAQDAISPHLDSVAREARSARQEVKQAAVAAAYAQMDAEMPDWRTINNDPKFHAWLRLPDIYSGQIRQNLINGARAAASAPRMLAFFRGFVQDGLATGSIEQPRQGSLEPAPPARQAAMPLESLAAPGKAKPAPGNPTPEPPGKPVFTRAQIAQFYADSRKGFYDGRKADYDRMQAELGAAMREGRIR
jgi:hypothetical protein